MSVITPKDCFHQPQVADLRLIACPGATWAARTWA